MHKTLAAILAKPESEISKMIAKFEEVCGYPSEDVRLLAEIKHRLQKKTAELGLDPQDTSEEELYYSLHNRFYQDSYALDRAVGVDEFTKAEDRIGKAVHLIEHCAATDDMWVVKKSVAKSILAKNPPKQVAKSLRYRSLSSLIKRVDIAEIYLAAVGTESTTWQKNISKQLSKLSNSDYETRPIKVIKMPAKYSEILISTGTYTVSDSRIGAIALWPGQEINKASVLTMALFLLEGIKKMNPDGYSDSLHSLNPSLRWWADCDYLFSGGHTVSFNIKDVAVNRLNNHSISDAITKHGSQHLWQELINRYKRISDSVLELAEQNDIKANMPAAAPKIPIGKELAAELAMVE